MSNSFHTFLGGTLGRVAIKLLTISLLVGIVLNFLGWTPRSLMRTITEFFRSLWETGFITLTNFFHMTMMGAIIVVPIFLLLRIFHKK
ncbi:hypothetical protein ME1_00635 [Bartonella vinsonii subsp. arupensis OK-94-513]|uniref:DUF6460 domain-containing protein n=2 Tax=Bartonella vinsonii subsp. arupensis TaxID=110578 RepID=J0QZ48_BARVI|nr:DUF6460 domain-containing protein [Bartonella vinsonii]EJF88464.1 hypothetical protein ME1_00635 [Bartonella vinsonii subsp. arupensis OK-94-513]EJF97930.1 hypothetical protein MEI_01116 [Bartonella vinsonii subsp. arupensis Pm136co]